MLQKVTASLFFLLNIFAASFLYGQNEQKNKTFNQDQFERNKIYEEIFHLSWYKNSWQTNAKDTLPYFVDDRKYKGIINYGVIFSRKDYKNFTLLENKSVCLLKVEIIKCNYYQKDSVLVLEGFVSGGRDYSFGKTRIKNQIDIFLGEKIDTINACYFGNVFYPSINMNKDTIEVKLNNKEIDEFTVLDSFPAFYLKNYSNYRTSSEGRRPFKISGKITKNTLIAFGARGCYSVIFDLGSMIYDPNKNKLLKYIKKEEYDCKHLIINNKLVADIEKEKVQKEEINYYTYTQKAENQILIRQYSSAKEQYNLLGQNYATIFSRDIHNAIRCAILSRDLKSAFWWSEKMALKGVEPTYFNSKIFAGMRKNLEWKSFIVKYDSICRLSKSNWNLKLKKELTDLINEDQADYGLENRKDSKTLFETTAKVTDKLIYLIKKYGYPSEEKIGSYVKNDTILISRPDYNVLIRHAIQQKPENLAVLNNLLQKSFESLEYDSKRSANSVMPYNSCFHIYKGNLYNSKSCGNNDLMVRKIKFMFNNHNSFIVDNGNYIVSAYNKENPKEWDDYYEQNFNFIMKLTDDWEFYEK